MSIHKCLKYLNEYPQDQDATIHILKDALGYLVGQDGDKTSAEVIVSVLQTVRLEYSGRNANELFNNLITAINLKSI